jgi:hypothetical protein
VTPGEHEEVRWTELVGGYQYEFLHTGVLQWLLESSRYGVHVARAVTGQPEVDAIEWTDTQTHAGGNPRTRPDLTAEVSAGDHSWLVAVETKVDSDATEDQIIGMCGHEATGVLLAVGATSLTLLEYETPPKGRRWFVVDVNGWLSLLDACDGAPNALAQYRDEVRREADEHAAARAAVRAGQPVPPGRHPELAARAWLGEVARAVRVDLGEPSSRFRTHRSRSGPVLFWRDSWKGLGGHSGVYLDLMVDNGRRRAVVKGAKLFDEHRAAACGLRTSLGVELQPPLRRASAKDDTFTIGRLDFDDDMPVEEAARAVAALRQAVRALPPDAV